MKKCKKSAKWPRHHGSGSFLQLKPRFRTFFRTFFALFSHFFTLFSQFSKQSWLFWKIVFSLSKMRKKCERSVKKVRKKVQKSAKKVRPRFQLQKRAPNRGGEAILHFFCTFFALCSRFFRIFSREKYYFSEKLALLGKMRKKCKKSVKIVRRKCEKRAKPRFQLQTPNPGGEAIYTLFTLYLHFICTLFILYLHLICTLFTLISHFCQLPLQIIFTFLHFIYTF